MRTRLSRSAHRRSLDSAKSEMPNPSSTPTPTPQSLRQMMARAAAAAATAAAGPKAGIKGAAKASSTATTPLIGTQNQILLMQNPMMNSISNSRRLMAAQRQSGQNNSISGDDDDDITEGVRGAPLPPVEGGVRMRKILQVAEGLKQSYTHPLNSQQVEKETLHRLRAILFMNRALITQSFVSHVTGVSQGSLSHYVRGFFKGNQRNVDMKLDQFVEQFASGDLDSYLEEIRVGLRSANRPLHFPIQASAHSAAAKAQLQSQPRPPQSSSTQPQTRSQTPTTTKEISAAVAAATAAAATASTQSTPIAPPPPPQLQPAPWAQQQPSSQSQTQSLTHNQLQIQTAHATEDQQSLAAVQATQAAARATASSTTASQIGMEGTGDAPSATDRAVQHVADKISGLIALQAQPELAQPARLEELGDTPSDTEQEHRYSTRRQKRRQQSAADATAVVQQQQLSSSPSSSLQQQHQLQQLQKLQQQHLQLQRQKLQQQQLQQQQLKQQQLKQQQQKPVLIPPPPLPPTIPALPQTPASQPTLAFPTGPDENAAIGPVEAVERAFHTLVASEWSGETSVTMNEPLLIPIEIYAVIEGFVMHMYTQWDVNERILPPEIAADRLRRARGLPPSFTPVVAAQIRRALFDAGVPCAAPPNAPPERRVMFRIRVPLRNAIGDGPDNRREYVDDIEWDIASFHSNSPELFARQVCADEGLPFATAVDISRALRIQLTAAQAIAYGDENTRKAGRETLLQVQSPTRTTMIDQTPSDTDWDKDVLPVVRSALVKCTPEMRREENEALVSAHFVQPLLDHVSEEAERRTRRARERRSWEAYQTAKRKLELLETEKQKDMEETKARAARINAEHGLDFRPYLSLRMARGERASVYLPPVFNRKKHNQKCFLMLAHAVRTDTQEQKHPDTSQRPSKRRKTIRAGETTDGATGAGVVTDVNEKDESGRNMNGNIDRKGLEEKKSKKTDDDGNTKTSRGYKVTSTTDEKVTLKLRLKPASDDSAARSRRRRRG